MCEYWIFRSFFLQCVIFGLQSTGEARTLDQLDELGGELNDFISTTKYGLLIFLYLYALNQMKNFTISFLP